MRVGDTLSERGDIAFTGLPDFAPELLRRVRIDDPMKTKQMRKGLQDLAEEGVIRVFRPAIGSNWIVGVVGALQLEVLATRMETEYGVKLDFEPSPYEVTRWVSSDDPAEVKRLMTIHCSIMAEDQDDDPVLLIRNAWELGRFEQDWPKVKFGTVKERS